MKKPLNVAYGVGERPPLDVTVLSGLQYVGLMSIYLVYPVLIAKAANGSAEVAPALLALALGTVLQAIPLGLSAGLPLPADTHGRVLRAVACCGEARRSAARFRPDVSIAGWSLGLHAKWQ
jgi:xanthine/uracil permease